MVFDDSLDYIPRDEIECVGVQGYRHSHSISFNYLLREGPNANPDVNVKLVEASKKCEQKILTLLKHLIFY